MSVGDSPLASSGRTLPAQWHLSAGPDQALPHSWPVYDPLWQVAGSALEAVVKALPVVILALYQVVLVPARAWVSEAPSGGIVAHFVAGLAGFGSCQVSGEDLAEGQEVSAEDVDEVVEGCFEAGC